MTTASWFMLGMITGYILGLLTPLLSKIKIQIRFGGKNNSQNMGDE